MKLTAELSLYPLQDDYLPAIDAFIEAARRHSGMVVVTNAMSTQVCGDYDAVFALVSKELRGVYTDSVREVESTP